MDDPSGSSLALVITSSLILAIFCKLARYVYNSFSYAKLDELLETEKSKNRLQDYMRKGSELLMTTSFFGVLSGVVLVLSILLLFSKNAHVPNATLMYSLPLSFIPLLFIDIFSLYLSHRYSEKIVVWILPLMEALYWVGIIFIWPLSRFIQFLDTVFITRKKTSSAVFQRAVINVVSKGEEEGVFQGSEKNMVEAIIGLREIETKEIMTPRTDMVCTSVKESVAETLLIANKAGFSRIPVYKENRDNIVGVFYVKDLLDYWANDDREAVKLESLIRKPYFIPETKSIAQLLKDFQEQKLHIAIVLDEYGGTAGIVTVEDILEEIVGEINDEHDRNIYEEIQFIDENKVELDARVHVEEVNEKLQINLPLDEGYDTIGGFLFSQAGRVPVEGESYQHEGWDFCVLKASERRIDRILMMRISN